MDSLPFNNLENSEFIDQLESVDLENVPMLDNIDFHFDFSKHNLNNVEKQLFEINEQALCKYYTMGDFENSFKSFNGVTFIHSKAKSLGSIMSNIRDSLNRLSLIFDVVAISERKIIYIMNYLITHCSI